jgi:diguanylate cyclase (GGDEF)-like protein/PAS domain S-box-containing protein
MKTTSPVPLNNVMDLLLDAICVVDMQGRFIFISAACERIFGYTPDEMIGRLMIDFVFPEDRPRTLQAASEIVAGQPQPYFENRYVHKDGRIVHVMWSARWSAADQVRVAVARDVTERKRADSRQAALYAISEAAHWAEDLVTLFQQIHQFIGGLLPATNFFVALYDEGTDVLSVPYQVDERDLVPSPLDSDSDSRTLSEEIIRSGQIRLLAPELGGGSLNWLGVPLNAKKGVIGALVVKSYNVEDRYTVEDVELLQFVANQVAPVIERKQMEAWLQHIARHDTLTDLPNRELFHDRLQASLRWAERNPTLLALLYLDLDKFKQVNDSLGHPVGDLLLQEVARRLKQCVRESDTIGRVGGDEFLVLLNGISRSECASQVAEKIRVALDRPFDLAGHLVHVPPSIGIALYPEHAEDYTQLIRHADEAMYEAKRNGGNCFQVSIRLGGQK